MNKVRIAGADIVGSNPIQSQCLLMLSCGTDVLTASIEKNIVIVDLISIPDGSTPHQPLLKNAVELLFYNLKKDNL